MRNLRMLLVLLMVVLASPVHAGDDEKKFDVYNLGVAGKVLQHWVEDLDGDGLDDIIVVHRKGVEPDETRWLSIFWQIRGKGYGEAADQAWEIDKEAAVLDIGDVAGDAAKEICYLTGSGVRYHELGADRTYDTESKLLFETTGLALFPSKRYIPIINFIRDWNGDGTDGVAIAGFDGLSIYRRGADGTFSSGDRVVVELETDITGSGWNERDDDAEQMSGIAASYKFPDMRIVDYNADGRADLIATTDERVVVFVQNPDGTYADPADGGTHRFEVRTKQERIEGTATVFTLISDINNDGYADAVVTKQVAKGLTNFRGVVNVFYGRPNGYADQPDQVIISEGTASAGAAFMDVNGDGREDLVLPSVKFSIAAIIRILVTRSIKVYFNIFLLGEDNRLSERPDFTKEVKFKIDLSGESDEQAMDIEGDYNGDKRVDFVFATNKEELSVFLGEPRGDDELFSKKSVTKVEADAFGSLSSPDLNGDGFSDMIIHYPTAEKRRGMLQVLLNRGRW